MTINSDFVKACLETFRPLHDTFGFAEPETETIGRETFVRFHRGGQTVSIAYEPGSAPIVEIFFPSQETGQPSASWATKDGVLRSQRIPRINVSEPFVGRYQPNFRPYLEACFREFVQVEHEWVAAYQLIQADRRSYACLIQPLPAGGGLIQVLEGEKCFDFCSSFL